MAVSSEALQRVFANFDVKKGKLGIPKPGKPKMEGIYLSKLQLKTLGENLINMSDGPDGLCFMIGIEKNEKKIGKTVEVVPYKEIDNGAAPSSREIFNNCIFRLNAGGLSEDSVRDLIFDANGHHKEVQHPAAADEVITVGSQRTPPPFA